MQIFSYASSREIVDRGVTLTQYKKKNSLEGVGTEFIEGNAHFLYVWEGRGTGI